MIKAVIWDIDGTLADSEPLHLQALTRVCANHNVDISDLADDHFVGSNLYGVWAGLCRRFPPGLTIEDWAAQLNAIYGANLEGLKPIPGAVEVIQSLTVAHIRQAAVSNSNRMVVDYNLEALNITKQMEFSLSLDDVCEAKPSPEPYLMALKRLNIAKAEVLAVEDSKTGVMSAKAAGIKVLGLGPRELEADQRITQLSEVLSIVGVA